jgi:hypothetical protein
MNLHRPLPFVIVAVLVVGACVTYAGVSMYAAHQRARRQAIADTAIARSMRPGTPPPLQFFAPPPLQQPPVDQQR